MQGYNWQIRNNIFDLKLLVTNPGNVSFVHRSGKQSATDNMMSLVYDNIVLNDLFSIGSEPNVSYFNNRCQNIPDAEKGLQVYQADATVGNCICTGGAWKRFNLV